MLIRSFACVALCVFAAGCVTPAKQTTPPPAFPGVVKLLATGAEQVRVVCFGDSVTGVYYHTGSRRAYADMLGIALKRAYPSADVSVINAGISGHTTVNALARIDQDVLAHKPQLVTVMFGLNDMTRVPMEEYANNLSTIIDKCRAIGAEVLLCTPNAVINTEGRPIAKLEQYVAVMRDVGAKKNVPVADCYAGFQRVRTNSESDFGLLMSDEIHPNMDGHKLFAQLMTEAIAGKSVSLDDVESPFPAIPKTLALVKEGKPVRVYAMPPYDALIAPVLQAHFPSAEVAVTPWPVEGKTLPQLEEDSKAIRKMGVDLVIVAIPLEADADSPEQYGRSYRWVMNNALSFSNQEWDVVAFPPSLAKAKLADEDQEKEAIARKLIRAQDLGTITRAKGDKSTPEKLLSQWLRKQTREPAN